MGTVQGNKWPYPATYGATCQAHIEPGHTACYYVDTETARSAPDENNEEAMASWCMDAWCYINPCNCDATEQYESDYFIQLFYSYAVCGSDDGYTGVADGSGNVAADCTGAAAPAPAAAADGASDAADSDGVDAVKPFVGALSAVAVVAS